MPRRTALLPLALFLFALVPAAVSAQTPDGGEKKMEEKAKDQEKEKKPPEERSSRTKHTLTLDGKTILYTAVAGTTVLKDAEGKAKASVFSISYIKDGVQDPATRPVTFSFNGGPGAAALWVNLGAFGPRTVAQDPEGMPVPPPARLEDNPHSLLDVSDLVFIDPVSTGFSRPAPGEDPKQFHGLDEDIQAVGDFIRLWLTRNERWASPKFIAGESYGTTRAAGLAAHLQDRYGLQLNGLILISTVLNWQNTDFSVGNDMGYVIYLPTYAATAWYHKKLPPELSGDLKKTLAEVEAFALGEYASALLQGDRLPPERRREIAGKVARFTGLSPDWVLRANLRVEHERFCKELLRDRGKTVGRLDGRFTGTDRDAVGEFVEFDPSLVAVDGPYVAAMLDHVRRELEFEENDLVYERLARVFPWKAPENRYANVGESLRQAMAKNPALQVLMAAGYYDMATPYFDAYYTADHLGLPPELKGNVRITTYESGHMMYIREADHRRFKTDVAGFLREALTPGPPREGSPPAR